MRSKTKKSSDKMILPASLWQFYMHYAFKGFWFVMILFCIVNLITFTDGIVWPYIQQKFIHLFEATVPAGMSLLQYSMPTIIWIIVTFILLDLTNIFGNFLWTKNAPRVRNQISEIMTDYVHKQSMSFWTSKMSGSINSQIGYISDGTWAFNVCSQIIGRIMIVCVNAGMLFSLNKYIAYLFTVAFVLRATYMWFLRKRIKKTSADAADANSALNGKLVDSFSNYAIVKYFAGTKKEEQALKEPRMKMLKTRFLASYMQRLSWAFPVMIWDVLYGLTMLFCIMLYQRGQMSVSDVVFATTVYMVVMGSINAIINQIPDVITHFADAKKAYNKLVMPINIVDKPNAPDLVVKKGLIEFRHIVFGYRNRPVLTDLMLRIKPGERVGVVGPSGAGKTTLVNLLMRFYEPKHGQILIDGQDISDITQDSLRSNIAFIPQDPSMFNRTIGENIGYGKFGATKAEIRKAAKSASADDFIMATEKKYNSLVGDKGIKLSGGQRQRIAIARAFLKDAPILVLDEATSALDSETEVAIQESFEKLSKGRTTIAIAHRLSTLRNMDRIIVLDKGVIVEQGTHQQLLRKKGKYYQLWQMQSGGFLQEEKHK